MTETTTRSAARTQPRRSALPRDVAMRLAADEYGLFAAQLRALSAGEWSAPTCCPAWDVHGMTCHVVGMAEFAASVREQMRQVRVARRSQGDGLFIDALTGLQTAKHAHRSPDELIEAMAEVGPRAARGRRRTPGSVRHRTMPDLAADETGTQAEPWAFGYLTDVILTRDTWMHRSDIAAAVGRPMSLAPEHDGVLIADVAAEWAGRHGQPCTLILTGPAGGQWRFNGATAAGDAATYELDAVEFARILSGRGQGDGLLSTEVPF